MVGGFFGKEFAGASRVASGAAWPVSGAAELQAQKSAAAWPAHLLLSPFSFSFSGEKRRAKTEPEGSETRAGKRDAGEGSSKEAPSRQDGSSAAGASQPGGRGREVMEIMGKKGETE